MMAIRISLGRVRSWCAMVAGDDGSGYGCVKGSVVDKGN